MTQKVAILDALIQASQDKPITVSSIQERIQASRHLTQSSIVLLKRSLERIQQQTILLESRLRETEQPLWQPGKTRSAAQPSDTVTTYRSITVTINDWAARPSALNCPSTASFP